MNRIFHVAMHEYLRNVMKGSFILALLSIPLMIALGVGLAVLITRLENDSSPVGYVDLSGLLSYPVGLATQEQLIEFISYENETAARDALERGALQAFYVISQDYLTSNEIQLYYLEEPGQNATRQFHDFIQLNLVAQRYPEIAERVVAGDNVILRSIDGKRELPDDGPSMNIILPLIISFALVVLMLMSSGYMMHAVVEEKENRTMEVLITTVSSSQLMAGKVLGILGIALTQLLSWTVFGILVVLIAGQGLGIEWFQDTKIEWLGIFLIVLLAIPTFIIACALMVAIGSTVTETQEAQWVVSIFMLLFWVPLWMIGIIGDAPNAPLAVILSFLPFTTLMTISIRNMFIVVPFWQIGLSVVMQIGFAIAAVWLAGKAFRLGLLRYGQKISLRDVLRKPVKVGE